MKKHREDVEINVFLLLVLCLIGILFVVANC